MEDYETRYKNVENYMKTYLSYIFIIHRLCPNLKVTLMKIENAEGDTTTNESYDAIMVSTETLQSSYTLNMKRVEKGWKPMKIIVIQRQQSYLLSSTFIRKQIL